MFVGKGEKKWQHLLRHILFDYNEWKSHPKHSFLEYHY
jgi:hypothetical protein